MTFGPAFVLISIAVGAGGVGLGIVASIIYRRSKGKPLFRPNFDKPVFLAKWQSGRSLRNAITRLGSARNCLWVAVNDGSVRIAPHFPFNLMFLPEIYGLEVEIPVQAIRSILRTDSAFRGNCVHIESEAGSGNREIFELWLGDPDAFIHAVEAIRRV